MNSSRSGLRSRDGVHFFVFMLVSTATTLQEVHATMTWAQTLLCSHDPHIPTSEPPHKPSILSSLAEAEDGAHSFHELGLSQHIIEHPSALSRHLNRDSVASMFTPVSS
ncbi:hypothetical protein PM082_024602 [Marasmius tenuissimus]|nr:hypothetical protein PM082_024602 [Marasmius tenuissimus]